MTSKRWVVTASIAAAISSVVLSARGNERGAAAAAGGSGGAVAAAPPHAPAPPSETTPPASPEAAASDTITQLEANLRAARAKADRAEEALAELEKALADAGADALSASRDHLETARAEVVAAQRELTTALANLEAEKAKRAKSTANGQEKGPSTANQEKSAQQLDLMQGGSVHYGLTLSLAQFNVVRSESEPAAWRNYAPNFKFVPTTIGFQFTYQPAGEPWRIQKNDESYFQLMSAGGMVLLSVDSRNAELGALSLGATLGFFEDVLGLGIGFDLYRGIPVRGLDGTSGGGTAYTGVLAWAFSPRGEVTPENVFVVLTLGLEPIVRALGSGGRK